MEFYSTIDKAEFVLANDEIHKEQYPKRPSVGRSPLTIDNPLGDTPEHLYMDTEGKPLIWLDDILTGAIRCFNLKTPNKVNNYVGTNKLCLALFYLKGKLTCRRISEALTVNYDTGWRILKVIQFVSHSIERQLAKTRRVISYQFELPLMSIQRGTK